MLSKFMFFCKIPGEYTIVEYSLGLGFFQYIYIYPEEKCITTDAPNHFP